MPLSVPHNASPKTQTGALFALPWIIGFSVFIAYPVAASLFYSFCTFDAIGPPRWIGLENYRLMLFEDPLWWRSLQNTMFLVVVGLPVWQVSALALAMLLNRRIAGIALYRTLCYLPSVTPVVAMSVLWLWMLNPEIGLVSVLLRKSGLGSGPAWLTDPVWAKPSLVLMGLWGVGGSMVIYLAALQDVPVELHEAAALDGASKARAFRHVTLPALSPVILFQGITGLIGAFQYFTQAYVMTNGGPDGATTFYSLHLFQRAFYDFKMGYASAMAWMLFLIATLCIVVLFKTSAKWVALGEQTA